MRISPELKDILIASKEGLPILSALSYGIDEVRLAALNASLLTVAEQNIDEIGLGEYNNIIIKGSEGYVISLNVNNDVFLTASIKGNARLGLMLIDLHRLARKINSKGFDGWDDDDLPYPYIFKPPSPPGDLGMSGQPQLKIPPKEEDN